MSKVLLGVLLLVLCSCSTSMVWVEPEGKTYQEKSWDLALCKSMVGPVYNPVMVRECLEGRGWLLVKKSEVTKSPNPTK